MIDLAPQQRRGSHNMVGLGTRERRLLAFIVDEQRTSGWTPTYQEIADHLGIKAKSAVHAIIAELKRRGYVRASRYSARSLEVLMLPEPLAQPTVTLNSEILTLTDRYAHLHGISRDTATNELLRIAFGDAA